MATPATDRLVKAELRFTWNNQLVENVLHFRHAIDAPTPANMADLAVAIDNEINPGWLSMMTSSATYREVYIESYAGELSIAHTQSGTGGGAAGTNSMPGNATFCLSLRTAFVGRTRRGRMYTIGMDETQQGGGVVTPAYRNNWILLLAQLNLAAAAVNWEWVVASFYSGGAPRPTGLVSPITSVIAVDDFVDSQRRRLQGRGT